MSEKDVTVVLANLPAALPELEAVYLEAVYKVVVYSSFRACWRTRSQWCLCGSPWRYFTAATNCIARGSKKTEPQ